MVIREVQDRDFVQLAEMRWTHAVEDDETYGEHNTDGVTKSVFIEEFVAFLYTNKEYKIFVAEDENAKIRQNGINHMGFQTQTKFLSADYNNKKYKRTIGLQIYLM